MLRRRRVLVLHSSLFPLCCSDCVVPCRDLDPIESNAPAISKFMKIKEDGDRMRSPSRESREFREFLRIPRIGVLGAGPLAEFELFLVISQALIPRLYRRGCPPQL